MQFINRIWEEKKRNESSSFQIFDGMVYTYFLLQLRREKTSPYFMDNFILITTINDVFSPGVFKA